MKSTEFAALARRMEKRHGPDKDWDELPLIRRPGRPGRGQGGQPLQAKSVKLPSEVWDQIHEAAERNGVATSAVVAGLALQVAVADDIDHAIKGLIKQGILQPTKAVSSRRPSAGRKKSAVRKS
jgi:hypothetical protein